jgi:GDP-L-galactose phosphorylase
MASSSAPVYITRAATVVSFQQLQEEEDNGGEPQAAAAAAAAAAPAPPPEEEGFVGPDGALLDDAPVAHIAGTRLPRYLFSEARVSGGLPRPASVDLREAAAAAERAAASAAAAAAAAAAGDSGDADDADPPLALGGGHACGTAGGCSSNGAAAGGSSGGSSAAASPPPPDSPLAAAAAAAAASALAAAADRSAAEALGAVAQRSLLDSALLALWDERAERGLFRYDVTACPTRVLPGVWGFVAQLNEGRANLKRPTEFRVDAVVQPFDGGKFNFKKAYAREVLFAFEPRPGGDHARPLPGNPLAGGRAPGVPPPELQERARAAPSPHLVIINVSPIDYGHVLLVPKALDDLPQLLTPETLRLALQFAQEAANPYLRVGYNSLGAYATINHLHFQAYYLACTMPYERAPTTLLPRRQQPRSSSTNGGVGGAVARAAAASGMLPPPGPPSALGGGGGSGGAPLQQRLLSRAEALVGAPVAGVRLSRTSDYPVRGFVAEGGTLAARAAVIGAAALEMQRRNQPHNVLVSDAGGRVFLFPQRYADRQARGEVEDELLETGVNPAAFEIAGHMVMKRRGDYDAMTQELAWRLLDAVTLTEEGFLALAEELFGGGGCPPPPASSGGGGGGVAGALACSSFAPAAAAR